MHTQTFRKFQLLKYIIVCYKWRLIGPLINPRLLTFFPGHRHASGTPVTRPGLVLANVHHILPGPETGSG